MSSSTRFKLSITILGSLAILFLAACRSTMTPHPVNAAVKGGSVFIDDGGKGSVPILFVHGSGGSSAQWQAQLAHFRAAGRRAVALDLPGFGQSSAPADGNYSLQAMADAIDEAVEAIHLNRFVIAGHSYGGAVVATYAAAHPEKVAGVVYVDAAATSLPITKEQGEQLATAIRADKMGVIHAFFSPMLKPSPQAVQDQVFASVEKTPAEVFIATLLSITSYDPKTLIPSYKGPRLAIAAADLETPMSMQQQFPDIPVVKIAGAGHWLMLDKPDEVNAAIDAFLEKVR